MSRLALPVALGPAHTRIETVLRSPAACPALPASRGVVSVVAEPFPGFVRLTFGAILSGLPRAAITEVAPAMRPSSASASIKTRLEGNGGCVIIRDEGERPRRRGGSSAYP